MDYFWLIAALLLAFVDWFAVARKLKPLEYIAKPGVMVALLLWLVTNGGTAGPILWFAIGVFHSMIGDIFLMLPRVRLIPGIIAFAIAHLAYLGGFFPSVPPIAPVGLLFFLLVTAAAVALYPRIAAGLERSGQTKLKTPVLIYTIIISLMLLAALFTLVRPEWNPSAAWLAATGALLFFISDSLLAWNRFVAPLPFGKLPEISAYHLGQILLSLGAGLQYLS